MTKRQNSVVACLFCQQPFDESKGRKRTREHVFADWMTPYLSSPDGPGTQVRWHSTAENRREDPHRFKAYPAQQAVQGVCEKCNNEWLSEMQTAAKPVLRPLLQRPRRRAVGDAAQLALAIWAYRAALAIGIKAGKARIPIDPLHEFYEARRPPDSCRIWMLATRHPKYTYIEHRLLAIRAEPDDEPPPSPNGFATLVAVGHVGFYVVRWTDVKPRGGMARVFDLFGDALVPIFPGRGPASWPPKRVLSHSGLDQLAEAMGIWESRQPP